MITNTIVQPQFEYDVRYYDTHTHTLAGAFLRETVRRAHSMFRAGQYAPGYKSHVLWKQTPRLHWKY